MQMLLTFFSTKNAGIFQMLTVTLTNDVVSFEQQGPGCINMLYDNSLSSFHYRISSVIRRSFFFFQNNPKDLDPSCKTDLDLLDCLGRVNLVL